MHARVTSIQAAEGHVEEVAHLLRYSLLPALRAAPGFLRAELLVAPAAGRCLTVTYWATPAALAASAPRTVAGMLATAPAAGLVAAVATEDYEVRPPASAARPRPPA